MFLYQKATVQRANQAYVCAGCAALTASGLKESDFSTEEWRVIERARADDCRILPGSKYRKQFVERMGKKQVIRTRIDLHPICKRHQIFERIDEGQLQRW